MRNVPVSAQRYSGKRSDRGAVVRRQRRLGSSRMIVAVNVSGTASALSNVIV